MAVGILTRAGTRSLSSGVDCGVIMPSLRTLVSTPSPWYTSRRWLPGHVWLFFNFVKNI